MRKATSFRTRIATRPVRSGPPAVSRYAATIFARLAKKTDYADPNLVSRWAQIVGPEFAALCLPGRMTGPNARGQNAGGKTLEVFTANGAAAARVQFEAEALRAKVNDYLGPGAVRRITVRQTGEAAETRSGHKGDAAHEAGDTSERAGDTAQGEKTPAGKTAAAPAPVARAPIEDALGRFRASVSARRKDVPARPPSSNGDSE